MNLSQFILIAKGRMKRGIRLTWDQSAVIGEDGFRIKWGTSTGTYTASADVGANIETYTIPSSALTPGTTYYWIVVGLLAGVEQTPSSESTFVTPAA